MKPMFTVVILIVVLTTLVAASATAAPLADACAPGAAYDPACDVDHDGDVDIFDIQLAASHWNQAGTWVSDNNHTHLGQVWTGVSGNPLTISGSFPTTNANAPLILSNSSSNGIGLRIEATGNHGIRIDSAGANGLRINGAGADGISVGSAGSDGVQIAAASDDGLDVVNAGNDGLFVGQANDDGVQIDATGDDGVFVGTAGSPSSQTLSVDKNGFEVAGAQGHGLYVGSADGMGVYVNSVTHDGVFVCHTGAASDCSAWSWHNGVEIGNAEDVGVHVTHAGTKGIFVCSTGSASGCPYTTANNGLEIGNAEDDGVLVTSAGSDGGVFSGDEYAGAFLGDIYVAGNCIGCRQANFAVNAGDQLLQPGDVVSIQSVTSTDLDTAPALWQVVRAQPGQAAVGVVAGRAEVGIEEEHRPSETGKRLVPREGVAQPGEYVTIVYSGPMRVKAASGESAIVPGTRLTAAADGAVRPLGTIKVQLAGSEGTADIAEGAPVIGVALEAPKDGMVWVLVNPQ